MNHAGLGGGLRLTALACKALNLSCLSLVLATASAVAELGWCSSACCSSVVPRTCLSAVSRSTAGSSSSSSSMSFASACCRDSRSSGVSVRSVSLRFLDGGIMALLMVVRDDALRSIVADVPAAFAILELMMTPVAHAVDPSKV